MSDAVEVHIAVLDELARGFEPLLMEYRARRLSLVDALLHVCDMRDVLLAEPFFGTLRFDLLRRRAMLA